MLFMIPAADPNYAPWKLPCAYGINHDYNILMAHQGFDKGEGVEEEVNRVALRVFVLQGLRSFHFASIANWKSIKAPCNFPPTTN